MVMFGETFTLRMQKYNTAEGTVTPVVNGGLPGYPDGLGCAWAGVTSKHSNLCYASMPSSIVPLLKIAKAIPHPFDIAFRSLLLALPKSLAPPTKSYGGVAMFDPEGRDVTFIQDPMGTDVSFLTGVTVHDNKLYLGTLKNNFIAVYSLD